MAGNLLSCEILCPYPNNLRLDAQKDILGHENHLIFRRTCAVLPSSIRFPDRARLPGGAVSQAAADLQNPVIHLIIRKIRRKAINANLKLVECPIRHLGTEEGYKIYSRLQQHLTEEGVSMRFNTMVREILVEEGRAQGVVTDAGETFLADEVVCAVGREGADWFKDKCHEIGIETVPGTVDIGVRVEVKFYSNRVVVDQDFETSIKGLRAIGDGAGVTRGLQQASANGLSAAESILKRFGTDKQAACGTSGGRYE